MARRRRLVHDARQGLDVCTREDAGADAGREQAAGRLPAVHLYFRGRADHGLGARRAHRPHRRADIARGADLRRLLLGRIRHHHALRQQPLREAGLAAHLDRRRPLAAGAVADGRDHRCTGGVAVAGRGDAKGETRKCVHASSQPRSSLSSSRS